MSRSGDALYLMLLLVLPIAALLARRLPIAANLKMALAWLAIFVGAFLLVALWQSAAGAGGSLGALLR